jgi:hypothetical protein
MLIDEALHGTGRHNSTLTECVHVRACMCVCVRACVHPCMCRVVVTFIYNSSGSISVFLCHFKLIFRHSLAKLKIMSHMSVT